MVLRLTSRSPGDQACLTPSAALLIADLTPALGRQNDTTWPYASALFVNCAAASTASRPASVTIASRPSVGRDQIAIVLILPRRQAKFLKFRNRPSAANPESGRLTGPVLILKSAPLLASRRMTASRRAIFETPRKARLLQG